MPEIYIRKSLLTTFVIKCAGWLKFKIPRQRYVKFRSNELIILNKVLLNILLSLYHGLYLVPFIYRRFEFEYDLRI